MEGGIVGISQAFFCMQFPYILALIERVIDPVQLLLRTLHAFLFAFHMQSMCNVCAFYIYFHAWVLRIFYALGRP